MVAIFRTIRKMVAIQIALNYKDVIMHFWNPYTPEIIIIYENKCSPAGLGMAPDRWTLLQHYYETKIAFSAMEARGVPPLRPPGNVLVGGARKKMVTFLTSTLWKSLIRCLPAYFI